MAGILDLIDPKLLASEAPQLSAEGEFSKGMRSGTLGMRSQASNFLGAAGNALGFEDFAKGQYADADALGMRAQAAAPRVNTWRDIGSAGDLGDWAAGTLGGLVPSAAVGVGAGLMAPAAAGAAGAMLAGTAAYAPLEIGDTVARQRAAGQPVDLGDAAMAGGLSAAGQSIVPGLVGAKLAGRAVSKAPMTAARGARAVVADAGIEAGAEFGGELTKQLGSTNTLDNLDYGAAVDNAVAGALGGGVMGGVGVVGDFAHQNASKVGQGVQATKNAATGLLDRAKGAAKDVQEGPVGQAVAGAATKVGETLEDAGEKLAGYEIPTQLTDFFDSAKTKAKTVAKQIADGAEVIGDPAEFASMAKDKFKAAVGGNDGERFKAVNGMLQELAGDVGMTPEQREKVTQAATDLGDRANQAVVAGVKIARDGFKAATAQIGRFAERVNAGADAQLADEGKTVKKSEDFSAVRSKIMEHVIPVLMDVRPELANGTDPAALNQLGDALRKFLTHISAGKPVDSDALVALMEVSNGRADEIIQAAYRAVDTGDKKQAAAVLKAIDQTVEAQRSGESLTSAVKQNLAPQHKDMPQHELQSLTSGLQQWAAQGREHADDPRHALKDREVRNAMREYFGDKVDAVLGAIEAAHRPEQNMLDRASHVTDEEGNIISQGASVLDADRTSPDGGKLVFHGGGPKGDNLMLADEHDTNASQYGSAAVQKFNKLKAGEKDPARVYRWVSSDDMGADHPWVQKTRDRLARAGFATGVDGEVYAEQEIGKYGAWTSEHSRQSTQLSFDELDGMRLDTHKHGTSPARIDTGVEGITLDAVKMTRAMQARFGKGGADMEFTEGDDKGPRFRMARMFIEAAAAAQDYLMTERGMKTAFTIPDSTVIGVENGQRVTFGDIKKLDPRTDKDKAYDADTNFLVNLRKEFRRVSGLDPKTGKRVMPKEGKYATALAQDKVLEKGRDIVNDREFAVTREQTADDNRTELDDSLDFDGDVERGIDVAKKGLQQSLAEAQQRIDEFGSLHGYAPEAPELRAQLRALSDNFRTIKAQLNRRSSADSLGSGQREIDPFGQIHQAANYDETRNPAPISRDRNEMAPALTGPTGGEVVRTSTTPMRGGSTDIAGRSGGRKATGAAGRGVEAVRDSRRVNGDPDEFLKTGTQTTLFDDGSGPVGKTEGAAQEKSEQLDTALAKEDYGHIKTAAEMDRFLSAAKKRYGELKAEDKARREQDKRLPVLQRKALATLDSLFGPDSMADLNSFYDGVEGESMMRPTNRNDSDGGSELPARSSKGLRDTVRTATKMAEAGREGTPDPKAVAAKKAALLEAASSGDPRLLTQLASSTDAKALQRALEALNADTPDANTRVAINTANDRLGALVRGDESVAYGMGTKKYSLEGLHVSNVRHDGKFDWRGNLRSGQGESRAGAGTYLMPAENAAAHANFKGLMESRMTPKQFEATGYERGKPATYHVTLNAEPHQIMLWDERFSKQPKEVQEALLKAARDLGISEKQIKGIIEEDVPAHEIYGYDLYNRVFDMGKVSDALDKAGIVGAKYRSARGPEYVVYRDSLITTHKVSFSLMRNKGADTYEVGSFGEMKIEQRKDGRWGFKHPASGERLELSDEFNEKGFTFEENPEQSGTFSSRERAKAALQRANDADHAYAYSRQRVTPNPTGPINRKEVHDYISKVLGQWVQLAWANFLHAGEFERVRDQIGGWEDVIRLSVHSLNPLSPAYHESMHAFFAKLTDMKHGDVMDVLERAASSAPVMAQLKKLLANEPDALRQLNNAEERAAYMYQFWASGQLQVGPQVKNVFQRIADFIRSVLGIWSNDERALEILRYFHEGDFAKDMATGRGRDLVQTKLIDSHRNAALEHARKMTEPLRNLGESLMVAGGQRLRDTGIPALRELADAMKLHGTADGEDAGYVPAARTEHAQRMNKLAKALRDTPEATLAAALESLQTKSNAPIDAMAKPEDRLAARLAKKALRKHLDDTFDYMRDAKVKVNDFGYGKDYFPRVYDAAYISSHQQEFKNVLARHGVNGADEVVQKLMVSNGNEFTVEVDKPGMQHLKPRKLAHIPDAELAPFMRKDVLHILSSYTSQATRRAEWARRFQDDGQGVVDLMNKAKHQGASDADLDAAQKFVRSVDGTLGDTINPEARRLMGNMIVYQNIRLLPLAIFSSVVDPMGVLVRGGTVGDAFNTFKRGVGEAVKSFKKNATDDDMTKLATDIGSIDDSMLAHTMSAIYMQGMASETGRKINDAFFRFNLMEQWNTSMRVGATQAAMGFLKRHADGKASKHSARWLNELGLQVGDVKLNAQGEVDVTDPRVKQSIIRWVDGAVLRPDAVDKPIWMSDPHFALIAHLKQFVFSFHETILKRVIHEYQHGNHAPAMALASYVPIMIAADMLKGLIQGGGSEPEWKRNWTAQDYVWSGVERAGLLGTGQFVVDGVQGGIGSLAGPTLEQLGGAVQVLGGKAQFAPFLIKSMPANALYSSAFETEPLDPRTTG